MREYVYSPLTHPENIRLLQLLPKRDDQMNIRCELFEYPFRNSGCLSYPYEAISYVWGSENKPCSIIINDQALFITQSLHALLLRLQDLNCSRIVWADAVCIDQKNVMEKEHQIQFMAEIYANANRVVVWLGETKDSSDQALEAIRLAGEESMKPLQSEPSQPAIPQQAVSQLLQRQWFQRVWVREQGIEMLVQVTKWYDRFCKRFLLPVMSQSYVAPQRLTVMPSV
jgi:hypothetical protein